MVQVFSGSPQAAQMLQLALFFLVAGLPIYLFIRRWKRTLKIGPIYTAVLTAPIVLVLWLGLRWVIELGRD